MPKFFRSDRATLACCCAAFAIQGVEVNIAPLLFVAFQNGFGISLTKLALLVSVNFGTQLLTDLVSARYAVKLGYRRSIVLAHILCGIGLVGMGVLPYVIDAYLGLMLSTMIMAVGSGLIEVMSSPIATALPGVGSRRMNFLHSFYCWGSVLTVLVSTAFFSVFGIDNWRFLCVIWSVFPFANAIAFGSVPIYKLQGDDEKGEKGEKKPHRYGAAIAVFFLLMICCGATEQSIAQWVSYFAECGLKVSKTVGDLLGLCLFVALMGVFRYLFSLFEHRIDLTKALIISSVICVASYLLVVFGSPIVSLIGCALCGVGAAILWPGTLSLCAQRFKEGGLGMFALLALCGDVGCWFGPFVVGAVSDAAQSGSLQALNAIFGDFFVAENYLRIGIFSTIVFAVVLTIALIVMYLRGKKEKNAALPTDGDINR